MSDLKTIQSGDGTITVATRGARILDCRVAEEPGDAGDPGDPGVRGVDENLFYDDGKGSAGDRLWVAPEVAYYWPSLEEARRDPVGTAGVPGDVDPGTYEVEGDLEDGGGVVLVNTCSLIDSRDEKAIGLEMRRTIATADRPDGLPAEVKCVSFGIVNELTVLGGDEGAVAAAWDILQVPPIGTLICPTSRKVDLPRSYYDPFGDKHVVSDETSVRFLIDAKRRIKMGIKPEDLPAPGLMGYYRPPGSYGDPGISSLIVRIFDVDPGERYIDIPRDHPAEQREGGDALQAYNDDLTYGPFGEMEFVAPAVVVGGCEYRETSCVTHVLVGPDAAIRAAGEKLLGVTIAMIG